MCNETPIEIGKEAEQEHVEESADISDCKFSKQLHGQQDHKTLNSGAISLEQECDDAVSIKEHEHVDDCNKSIDLSNKDKYECKLCLKTFRYKQFFLNHMERTHDEKKFDCMACHKIFGCKTILDRHVQETHNIVKYDCKVCCKIFTYKQHRDEHRDTHHEIRPKVEGKYKCDACHKKFNSKISLKRHVRVDHDKIEYGCERCSRVYKDKASLKNHTTSIHGENKPECNVCHKTFNCKQSLSRHVTAIHSENIVCKICHKKFNFKDVHDKHEREVHKARESLS